MEKLALTWMSLSFLLGSSLALAGGPVPVCLDGKKAVPVDNAQVIQWKTSTANQFLSRGHVQGRVTRVYKNKSGHNHFEIDLGPGADDTLEIVYNISFGKLPDLKLGMEIEACGDYITSNAQTSQYPASPDGAILHWVHRNPKGKGHDSGYVVVDGVVFGQGNGTGALAP
jgi:hypothetical protein